MAFVIQTPQGQPNLTDMRKKKRNVKRRHRAILILDCVFAAPAAIVVA